MSVRTARQSERLNIQIDRARVPSTRVDPGDRIPVTVELTNFDTVGPFNDDWCSPEDLVGLPPNPAQTDITVTASLGNVSATDRKCIENDEIGVPPGEETYNMTVAAPQSPGEYTLGIDVSGTNTGITVASTGIDIEVEGSEPDPEPDPDPDPDPEPDPTPQPSPSPDPGLLARLLQSAREFFGRVINGVVDFVYAVRDLIVRAGSAVADLLRSFGSWLSDNPLLLAAVLTVAIVIVPRAVNFVFNNFTPLGWLKRVASRVL
jgi:hypothetical protein